MADTGLGILDPDKSSTGGDLTGKGDDYSIPHQGRRHRAEELESASARRGMAFSGFSDLAGKGSSSPLLFSVEP